MFGFYPRPQPAFYQPSYHSPYYAQQRRRELERALQAQELERRRRARAQYFPYGYDDDDDEEYVTPQQYALLRRKQLDAARLAQAQQQQQRQRAPSPVLPDADTLPPSPSTSSQVPPKPAPTPEQLAAAATTIQTAFRTRRALRAVSSLAHDFALLKSAFAAPPTIDFLSHGQTLTLPVPPTLPPSINDSAAKLAYTPGNVALHTYAEMLSRVLVSLDAVDSRGDRRVRAARKEVVRAVEAEAARVEAFWRGVWAEHVRKEEEEVAEMVAEEEDEEEFATPAGSPVPQPAVVEDDFVIV